MNARNLAEQLHRLALLAQIGKTPPDAAARVRAVAGWVRFLGWDACLHDLCMVADELEDPRVRVADLLVLIARATDSLGRAGILAEEDGPGQAAVVADVPLHAVREHILSKCRSLRHPALVVQCHHVLEFGPDEAQERLLEACVAD